MVFIHSNFDTNHVYTLTFLLLLLLLFCRIIIIVAIIVIISYCSRRGDTCPSVADRERVFAADGQCTAELRPATAGDYTDFLDPRTIKTLKKKGLETVSDDR